MPKYIPSEIEAKWQKQWQTDSIYRSVIDHSKPKFYALTMLPYPSGNLHMGHWYAMTPSDARARYKRMSGYNVLFPMGFDAFGLPAENAAIKRNIHPRSWTYDNISHMRNQLKSMGTMFDWQREAISCDPEYYRWTQWFFTLLYRHGLAYRKYAAVDWCPHCNTTLAREQVVGEDRHCERCDTPVTKRELEQWFFRATQYADELLRFDDIDWPEKIITMQTHWIGRSEGAQVFFPTESGDSIEVFTTRPDTLWGATFMVLAPEHPLVAKLTSSEQQPAVTAYAYQASRETDIEREATDKEKTGVFTGGYAINPATGKRIPVWIADYVLMSYGTGAIMAVPAGDSRDFDFARKYGLEIIPVVQPQGETIDSATLTGAYDGAGVMVNSGVLDGLESNGEKGRKNPAIAAAIDWLVAQGAGAQSVNYRYRDWLISRQRYWGAPIPMVYCPTCGVQPVPDEQLPITLPDDVDFKPTGESPLKFHPTWKHTTCPQCGAPAERETDTMDTFMCSSWYHLRYLGPQDTTAPFPADEYRYWMPVDTYTGGAEHATMHLLYTRFFHKALRDMGIVSGAEPMIQLRNQGSIQSIDGKKMSKSKGNVIDPDEKVRIYGADVVRAYLMFGYRWNEGGPWNDSNISGVVRWLNRLWDVVHDTQTGGGTLSAEHSRALQRKTHQTIQKITRQMETFEFNTVVSSLMELTNAVIEAKDGAGSPAFREAIHTLLLLSAPVSPHIAEELWAVLGRPYSIHQQAWPQADEALAREDELELPVQVNGKLRGKIVVPATADTSSIEQAALQSDAIRFLEGRPAKKVIVVPGRLVNIVG
jgi:leucyl-tRNA synthetase